MKFRNHFLRMEQAGDGQGSGGGTLLTGNNSGGGSPAPQGGAGAGNQSDPQKGAANSGGQGGGAQGGQANDWRSQLPAELREDPSLKVYNDVQSLAKAHIHAQKMVGADKISIPGKHATEDDWKQVFSKLGLPQDLKEYQVKLEGETINPQFVEGFKEAAHKAGILPSQAQKLADWFGEVNKASEAEIKKSYEAAQTKQLEQLKTEWGVAYDTKLKGAAQVIREAGDENLIKYLDASGLGNDTNLIRLLANVHSKYFKEDTAVGGEANLGGRLTPAEAQKAANAIFSDYSHPYYNPDHANHKAAVAEVTRFLEMANPTKKSS